MNNTLSCVLVQIHIKVISGIMPKEKRRAICLSQKERKSQGNDQKKDTSLDEADHNGLVSKNQTKSQPIPYISQHVSISPYF